MRNPQDYYVKQAKLRINKDNESGVNVFMSFHKACFNVESINLR